MQTLDIHHSEMPDLQFVLIVTALCTSRLTALNIPETLRATIFNRCWALIHESPPPRRPEDRILDLRPWTGITVEAMAETIRMALTEAGIQVLAWDHAPSEPTRLITIKALPVIDRFDQLDTRPSRMSDTASRKTVLDAPDHRDSAEPDIFRLVDEIDAMMAAVTSALVRCAADLVTSGKDSERAGKLLKGADFLRDNRTIYLTWARRYGTLADHRGERTEDADESGDHA